MNCDQYKEWDLGKLNNAQFQTHVSHCPECQRHLSEDEQLMALAQTLKTPVQAPQLWSHIEQALNEDQSVVPFYKSPMTRWLAIAAILIFGIGIGYLLQQRDTPSGLLTAATLAQVEQTERDYIAAIEQISQRAQSKFHLLDPDLNFLYRDKLAVIDEQIAQCQDAIHKNPGNAHVRRYMLAALKDKRETLEELIAYQPLVQ